MHLEMTSFNLDILSKAILIRDIWFGGLEIIPIQDAVDLRI
jgi:hypothetical protein